MISKIRDVVEDLFGSPAGKQARVLYGGSANSENTKAFLSIKGVDGLLIGGASLNYQEFASMIKIAQDL